MTDFELVKKILDLKIIKFSSTANLITISFERDKLSAERILIEESKNLVAVDSVDILSFKRYEVFLNVNEEEMRTIVTLAKTRIKEYEAIQREEAELQKSKIKAFFVDKELNSHSKN